MGFVRKCWDTSTFCIQQVWLNRFRALKYICYHMKKNKFVKFVRKIFHAFSSKKAFSTAFSRVRAAGRNTLFLFFSVLSYFACYKVQIMRVLEYPHRKNPLLSLWTNLTFSPQISNFTKNRAAAYNVYISKVLGQNIIFIIEMKLKKFWKVSM